MCSALRDRQELLHRVPAAGGGREDAANCFSQVQDGKHPFVAEQISRTRKPGCVVIMRWSAREH